MHEKKGQPKVILSAGNVAHYHHTALALQQAGYLQKYFCVFGGVNDLGFAAHLLSEGLRKRLAGKALSGLDSTRIRTFAASYLFPQFLYRFRLIDQANANLIFGSLYDWITISKVDGADVFHFVNSMGLKTAQQMKKKGGIVICDVRAEQVDYQDDILRSEYDKLGLVYNSTRRLIRDRLIAEYQLADALFVPSSHVLESLANFGVPLDKIFIVPYGVDVTLHSGRASHQMQNEIQGGKPFRILFVGQLIPRKGIHYLLRAFTDLNLPDGELLIVGQGDAGYLEFLQKMKGNNRSIRFLGQVPHIDLWKYYQEADIFVLPSLSEGSALVVYEAMAAGLPVITTPNAGAVLQDETDGFIVPIRDVNALREKILYLYEHPNERKTMGASAMNRVQEYTWERYAERLLAAYDQVLAQKGY